MFDQTFVDTANRTRNPWSMAASLTVQSGLVGVLLLVPLLHPEGPFMKIEAPPLIYRPVTVVPVPEVRTPAIARPVHSQLSMNVLRAPTTIPRTVADIHDAPEVMGSVQNGFSTIPGAIPSSGIVAIPSFPSSPVARPVAEKVETPPPPSAPIRVSTSLQSALLKFGPKPVYPPLARAARVQGTVRLTAVIATDGTVKNLRLISGPPLLQKASLDTVATWRYQPTILNGVAVEVITEIDVNFTLGQ